MARAATVTRTRAAAGSRRRTRLALKRARSRVPVPSISLKSSPVMRNPEMTKNTSTPTYPPDTAGMPAWNNRIRTTATARIPSMSGRKWPDPVALARSEAVSVLVVIGSRAIDWIVGQTLYGGGWNLVLDSRSLLPVT